ncbi:MAG: DUF664 domain-containing protein [Sphingobacteriales bacterium]|nr:MAG: DUF664 domain-containing protein [Sphingobacteriales bacterium]
MKETLLTLAKYNLWANGRMVDAIAKLPDEKLKQELVSSFPTIQKTVWHCVRAESIWMQRLNLVENPVWLDDSERPINELCDMWLENSKALIAFVEKQFDDNSFTHVFEFYRDKHPYKMQVYHTLLHAVNHNTYHRGQLVTMLRQVGVTKIPVTDLSAFNIQ